MLCCSNRTRSTPASCADAVTIYSVLTAVSVRCPANNLQLLAWHAMLLQQNQEHLSRLRGCGNNLLCSFCSLCEVSRGPLLQLLTWHAMLLQQNQEHPSRLHGCGNNLLCSYCSLCEVSRGPPLQLLAWHALLLQQNQKHFSGLRRGRLEPVSVAPAARRSRGVLRRDSHSMLWVVLHLK